MSGRGRRRKGSALDGRGKVGWGGGWGTGRRGAWGREKQKSRHTIRTANRGEPGPLGGVEPQQKPEEHYS